MNIRAAIPESDFPQIIDLFNQVEPEPVMLSQFQQWSLRKMAGRIYRQMVATDTGERVVGYSEVIHEPWKEPGHFFIWVVVDQGRRECGIGAALFNEAQAFLQAQGVSSLASEVRDHHPQGLQFAQRRGFSIDRHHFESSLDISAFDETPYLPSMAALEEAGIRFLSLAALNDSPDARHKLYELNRITALEIPGVKQTFRSYVEFEQTAFQAEWYRPEGQLLAADGEKLVGLSAVRLIPQTRGAYNLMTGVLSAYRGRKIAQALKVKAIRYAGQHGAQFIYTNNDSLNAPILAINRKLGYRPKPGKFILKG